MLSRPFASSESIRRCSCGHVMVARIGDCCPRCHRFFPDVAAIHDALIHAGHAHGPHEVARLAPVLGVEGRCVTDGRRVFGVVA